MRSPPPSRHQHLMLQSSVEVIEAAFDAPALTCPAGRLSHCCFAIVVMATHSQVGLKGNQPETLPAPHPLFPAETICKLAFNFQGLSEVSDYWGNHGHSGAERNIDQPLEGKRAADWICP